MSGERERSESTGTERGRQYKATSTAQRAFQERDVELSRMQHELPMNHGEPHGSDASDYVKSVVFGGLDGIMTTFAIIAAAAGSSASYTTILVFGFSNVVADAFSMGFGEFVSGNAEAEHYNEERSREEWEVNNAKHLEVSEMIEVYQHKGLSLEDATALVDIISKDDRVFVDFMMRDELGIVTSEDPWEPLKQGIVMFLSFITFGSVPLLAYALTSKGRGIDSTFWLSCGLTAIALLVLGAIKGHLTGTNIPKSSLLMVCNGVVSGIVSFGLSFIIDDMMKVPA